MITKKYFALFLLFFVLQISKAQLLSNGNFALGTLMWGCGAEVSAETVYGGLSTNNVAEVDAVAGLCQTYIGFTIGNAYVVSFNSSRRTGGCPSPAITNVDVSVSGGVLGATVTRTNTTFGWSSNSYLFIANSIIHTITFSPGSGMGSTTCGMIIDNVSVSFSPLPIELLNFAGVFKNNTVEFDWATATEKDNDFFEIERSQNGVDFEKVMNLASKAPNGNSTTKLTYKTTDISPLDGTNYYRLKQTDFDGTSSYSKIIAVSTTAKATESKLYPNPSNGNFSITTTAKGPIEIKIADYLGSTLHSQSQFNSEESTEIAINPSQKIAPGIYQCVISSNDYKQSFRLVVQ